MFHIPTLITSYNRYDLLEQTLLSFFDNISKEYPPSVFIYEDFPEGEENLIERFLDFKCKIPKLFFTKPINLKITGGLGQHGAIEKYLNDRYPSSIFKYYIHLEDDWLFNNTYDWISKSIEIMENDPLIIKVLCRDGSPHPCNHDPIKGYGELDKWVSPDGILWHGFSWNPGVTRADLLRQFIPFPKNENELSEIIYNAGYKVVELIKPVYKHIGDGRSTH